MQLHHSFFKNAFLLTGLILLLGSCGFQQLQAQDVRAGWVVGGNLSDVEPLTPGTSFKPGITLGAFMAFKINDFLQFQPEMLFDQMGYQSNQEGVFPVSVRSHYLSFPLLLNFTLPIDLGDNIRDINFQAGLIPASLINVKDKISRIDQTDLFRKIDLQYAAGITLELSDDVSFVARYSYSSRSIVKNVQGGVNAGPFNENVHLSIRWNFLK